jgi:hypothetical protein
LLFGQTPKIDKWLNLIKIKAPVDNLLSLVTEDKPGHYYLVNDEG